MMLLPSLSVVTWTRGTQREPCVAATSGDWDAGLSGLAACIEGRIQSTSSRCRRRGVEANAVSTRAATFHRKRAVVVVRHHCSQVQVRSSPSAALSGPIGAVIGRRVQPFVSASNCHQSLGRQSCGPSRAPAQASYHAHCSRASSSSLPAGRHRAHPYRAGIHGLLRPSVLLKPQPPRRLCRSEIAA